MSQKNPRNTKKKLHASRVRAEREAKGDSKAERQEQKRQDAEWREIERTLKGVQEWTS